ncbi:unnamed protein product [Arctia plantaginis]|uniref:Uncharacterized protein n=1 Tax=Arctia plantaginis TaxID=874455 RepID=A0A8S1B0F4_ARCPL|nr:unnamed protein product [Arctia plantaginis]
MKVVALSADDETKCYYCADGLQGWKPDDVKLVKEQDYKQKVMTGVRNARTQREVKKQRTLTGSPDPDCKQCKICYKEMRNVCYSYVPCVHVVACSK